MSHPQYGKMTLASLELLLSQTHTKLLELKLEEDPNESAMQKINVEIDSIAETIKTKTENVSSVEIVENDSKLNAKSLHIQKELQNAMRDYVPTFQSGVDVPLLMRWSCIIKFILFQIPLQSLKRCSLE